MASLACRRVILLGAAVLLSGCGASTMESASATVTPVAEPELQHMARADEARTPLELEMWGSSAPTNAGEIVVVTGEVKGEPFRLWFMVTRKLEAGQTLELRTEDAAQLTVGEPYRFISNRVALLFRLDEQRQRGFLEAKATRNELSRPTTFRLKGNFPVRISAHAPAPRRAAAASSELLPRRDYVPEVLPYSHWKQGPPEGYKIRRLSQRTLILTGSVAFGIGYVLPLTVAASLRFDGYSGWFAAPVVGPIAFLLEFIEGQDNPPYGNLGAIGVGVVTVSLSLLQLSGLARITAGLLSRRGSWVLAADAPAVATQSLSLRFSPVVTPSVQGLSFSGTF